MPYKSDAQRRWAHTDSAKKEGFPTEEFDKASKGKDLPEKAPKMADGGIISYTPPVPEGQKQPDEFTNDMKAGVNGDFDKVKDYLIGLYGDLKSGKPMGAPDSTLEGLHNVMAGNTDTEEPPKMAGGGIAFPHREKSGPSINGVSHPDYQGMADGGVVGDDTDDVSPLNAAFQQLTSPFKTAGSAIANGLGEVNGGIQNLAHKIVTPPSQASVMSPNLPPAAAPYNPPPVPSIPAAAKPMTFNPQAGLPAAPPPAAPAVAPAEIAPDNSNAITDYLNQQKNALNKYGPEQQLAVEQAIRKGQNSPGSLVGQGLAGLGDALMQGVARAGNPGYLKSVQERQEKQGQQQLGAMQNAGQQQMAQVEAKMKLDAIDPNSGLSKATQKSYTPILSQYGWSPSLIKQLSAQDMQQVSGLMSQYVGKNLEMHMKQLELSLTAQKQAEEARHNKSTEAATEESNVEKAQADVVKPPTSLLERIAGPFTGAQRAGAAKGLAETAGVAAPAPQVLTATNPTTGHQVHSHDGGKTWQ
jgi:hypothetical protein